MQALMCEEPQEVAVGWYESPKNPGVLLGDEAFDVVNGFLVSLARLYREEHGRPPTLEEVRVLMEIGLRVAAPTLVQDLDRNTVSEVAFRTRAKPKQQLFETGDVLSIPLGSRFAFARVLDRDARGLLIEVFRETSEAPGAWSDPANSGRLFPPIRMTGSRAGLPSWRWQTVHRDPNYRADDLSLLEFYAPDPVGGWAVVSYSGNVLRRVSEVPSGIELNKFWSAEQLEKRIRSMLAAG